MLASYASHEASSKGRKWNENYTSYSSIYLKDRERIVHTSAFRRLEYKTQVFINHFGDHYRNRLTHSLEAAQISRIIARELKLNEDLAECIALAHDIGHPPFGHAGEDALRIAAKDFYTFDHNAQTIKVLVMLEQKYAEFDGLNLSWETLEGIAKHNGPIENPHQIFEDIEYNLELTQYSSLEAQCASLADDISYLTHDIDDGLRAGFFTMEELKGISLFKEIFYMLEARYPDLENTKMINECIRRFSKYMIKDLVAETSREIITNNISTSEDVRSCRHQLVKFSPTIEEVRVNLKKFLFERVYKHYKVNRMVIKAHRIINELFNKFMEHPECLPTEWFAKLKDKNEAEKAIVIVDYIAGMTDRYAIEEHNKLFDPSSF